MDPVVKWIGGGTAMVVAGLAGLLVLGRERPPAPRVLAPTPEQSRRLGEAIIFDPARAAKPAQAQAPAPRISPDGGDFVIKRVLPIDGPIRYGEWHWDDAGVPDGPLVMTVDLDARVLSIFRGGYEIGAAAVMLGTDDHPTPLGVFPILSKERHNVSEKYGNAPMPWTLRLTPDGVAIHGGSTVERGYASHGCIGVPDDLAARLFAIARTGDTVIITRGRKAGLGTSLAS